jgi:hypothetical protein
MLMRLLNISVPFFPERFVPNPLSEAKGEESTYSIEPAELGVSLIGAMMTLRLDLAPT